MKKFNGFEDAKKQALSSGSAKLPVGAYVCKVAAVKYESGTNGNSDRILIQYDIEEGEYKGFFKSQYEANQNEDKKYKGQTAIYVPSDDGSERILGLRSLSADGLMLSSSQTLVMFGTGTRRSGRISLSELCSVRQEL